MNKDSIFDKLCERYPVLISVKHRISRAVDLIISCYTTDGKLLVCGNGGSSSDADHLVGELMKSFELKRPLKGDIAEKLSGDFGERGVYLSKKLDGGLPAISLTSQSALTTAISNDIDANLIFAQQVAGYGKSGDILIAISTSGNAQNVVDACITARAMNIKVIGLTGLTGGHIKDFCDVLINVSEKNTAYVQELHLPVLHTICQLIENHFFSNHN
jgi:D-sedoheptulose 7-phosphate isomerase